MFHLGAFPLESQKTRGFPLRLGQGTHGDFSGRLTTSEKIPQVTEVGQSCQTTGEFGKHQGALFALPLADVAPQVSCKGRHLIRV